MTEEPREFVCSECGRNVIQWTGCGSDDLCSACAWVRARLKDGTLEPDEEDVVRRRLGNDSAGAGRR